MDTSASTTTTTTNADDNNIIHSLNWQPSRVNE